jgi:hypothetical protein
MTQMTRIAIAMVFFLSPLIASGKDKKDAQNSNETVTIQAVVSQVKEALSNVQTKLTNKQLPPLKSVKLTLQTVATSKAGGKISFWVITIGGSLQKEASQEVVLELVPPKAGNPVNISSETFTKALEDSILDAAQGVQGADQGSLPLKLENLSVTLGFTVTAEGTAGAKLTLAPVTLDISGQKDKKVVHKLEVAYSNTSAEKK